MVFSGCFGQCLRVYFRGGGAAAQADVSTPAAVRNRHDDDCLTVPLMEEVWVHNAQGGWEGGHLTTQVGGAEPALEVGAGQMNELSFRQRAREGNIAAPNRESSQVTSSDFSVFSEATHVQTEGGGRRDRRAGRLQRRVHGGGHRGSDPGLPAARGRRFVHSDRRDAGRCGRCGRRRRSARGRPHVRRS